MPRMGVLRGYSAREFQCYCVETINRRKVPRAGFAAAQDDIVELRSVRMTDDRRPTTNDQRPTTALPVPVRLEVSRLDQHASHIIMLRHIADE